MLHLNKRICPGLVLTAAILGLCATGYASEAQAPATSPPTNITPPPPGANQTAWSAGIPEILKMLDAKVDPEVIKAYVRNSPFGYHPTAEELIALRDRGASADVLTAMLQHGPQAPASVPLTAAPDAAAVAPQGAYPTYTPPAIPSYDYSYPDYGYAAYPYYGYYPYYPYYDNYWWPGFSFGWYWPWYWNSGRFFAHHGFDDRFGHGFRGGFGHGFRGGFGGRPFAPGFRGGGGFHGGFVAHSGGFAGHGGGFAGHGGGGFGGGHGGGGHR